MHLCSGLSVSQEKVAALLENYDPLTAARNLGHDVDNYDHIFLAGRLLVEANKNVTPPNIATYNQAFDDLLSPELQSFFSENQSALDELLDSSLEVDMGYDWISANVLYKTYLAKSEKSINGVKYRESPRFMHLRLAAHMYQPNLEEVKQAYKELSEQLYFHATPTNINAGTRRPQCSSCFLLSIEDDLESITGVGVHQVAQISKHSGGLGIDVSRIRHSRIKHSGMSQGLVPMLFMYNAGIRYVNQCFSPETRIFTLRGLLPIEEILPGDEVLTVDGSFQRVVKVLPYSLDKPEKSYKITTPLGQAAALGDHPMYSLRACASLDPALVRCLYTGAGELKVGDYLYYPLPEVRNLDYLEEELYIYGALLANGEIGPTKTTLPYESKVKGLLEKLAVPHLVSNGIISFNTGALRITPAMKKLPISFYLLPTKKLEALHAGMGRTDAYMELILGETSYPRALGGYLLPITEIEEGEMELVYDLEIDSNHNYATEIGLAHNGGRRKGAATIYCRPHHTDILDFVELNQITGDPYSRCHDLDLAVWTPWLFWKRVEEDGPWSLFCPALTKSLNRIWGVEFIREYERLEKDESIPRKTYPARKILEIILENQKKGGKLYTLGGDGANFKSNQKNLGYISNANLCLEVIQYNDQDEYAACNLAQISLAKVAATGQLDYQLLGFITTRLVANLNRLIDRNWFPYKQIYNSNQRHRPMGIGVSGFAEMLHQLDLPFEDEEVRILNKRIFACIYFNALAASVSEAISNGPYESFPSSPTAQGKLQFHLWAEELEVLEKEGIPHNRQPADDLPLPPAEWGQKEIKLPNNDAIQPTWEDLVRVIKIYGLRNSLLIALMPTATSSVVLRNCESVEAHQTNIYSRKLSSGNYPIVNRFLFKDLQEIGLWNNYTVQLIEADEGSVAHLDKLVEEQPQLYPDFTGNWQRLRHIQKKYRTMWELPQVLFLKMAAERARYVCQSQSTNLYYKNPSLSSLQKAQVYAAKAGLKTFLYYLRQQAAVEPLKINISAVIQKFLGPGSEKKAPSKFVCMEDVCTACQ